MEHQGKDGDGGEDDLPDDEQEAGELMQEEPEDQEEDLGIQEINDDDESQDIFDNFEKSRIRNEAGGPPIPSAKRSAYYTRAAKNMLDSKNIVGHPSSAQPNTSTTSSKPPQAAQTSQNLSSQERQQPP